MSEPGAVEQWMWRWGHPDESGERVWFTGEIETHVEGQGMDVVVPIFAFARAHDAEDAKREALVARLVAALGAELTAHHTGPSTCTSGQRDEHIALYRDALAAAEEA